MAPRLYFAYGSNMSISQMARRCPNSHYEGRAILPDFEWQINERGVANIVPSPGHCVHGLIYRLGSASDDEERLDRSEGVRGGFYSKRLLSAVVYGAPEALRMRTNKIDVDGGAGAVVRREVGGAGELRRKEKSAHMENEVLVYVSNQYVRSGEPRPEYVHRMNTAIRDGVALGIPEMFFDNAVRSYIVRPGRPTSDTESARRPRRWRSRSRPSSRTQESGPTSQSSTEEESRGRKDSYQPLEGYHRAEQYKYGIPYRPGTAIPRDPGGQEWERMPVEQTKASTSYRYSWEPIYRTVTPPSDCYTYTQSILTHSPYKIPLVRGLDTRGPCYRLHVSKVVFNPLE